MLKGTELTLWDLQALSGVSGGGMTTVVAIIWSDIVPLRERGVWQGLSNLIYAAGSGLGGPLGQSLRPIALLLLHDEMSLTRLRRMRL